MKKLLTAILFACLIPILVFADGRELTIKNIRELQTLTAGNIASGDLVPVYDASTRLVKSVDATTLPLGGAFNGTVGATTPNTGEFTTIDASGTVTLDDGTGASPSLSFIDATNESATFSKADSGYLSITTLAADGLEIVTGSLLIGNGTPDTTVDGEDLYVEGGFEVDGVITIGSTAITHEPLINPGRDHFTICGEATTINNNTVFYGPSIVLLPNAGNGQTCDINAVGNVTEATADAPIYTNQAVQILGMTCRNEADANADISFTLRTAAGATVPSVTCSIADGERDCVADIQTTTAIAAAATVAIAGASTGDIADANGFVCTVGVAY